MLGWNIIRCFRFQSILSSGSLLLSRARELTQENALLKIKFIEQEEKGVLLLCSFLLWFFRRLRTHGAYV